MDKRKGISVPDGAVEQVLKGLFDRFNFTVMESTPFDIEVAVDPEMLGKVFEKLVTGRRDSGAYYTPRAVVSFMCREALKGYLEGKDTGADAEAIARFVGQQDPEGITLAAARRVSEALSEVTVVDPACGSGAYLLGMMQELIDLQSTLYNAGVDSKSLYDLKLEIIQRNLYGVDIDDFAVNIAMLRMWLSLSIEFDDDDPLPLPNLDFKVLCGDSLLGPDPSVGVSERNDETSQIVMGREPARMERLDNLKSQFLRATSPTDKNRLRAEIDGIKTDLKEALGDASSVPEGAVDWRVEFAEVFAVRRGFDIAIANPPYVQLQKDAGRLGKLYGNCGYATFASTGDVYQLFYERGCQTLRPDRGILAFITSNSWLKAEYGKSLRRYFAEKHTPLLLLELGKDVFESAIVDSGVLMLSTGGPAQPFRAVDMDRVKSVVVPPPAELWGGVRPGGDAPWSVLSLTEDGVLDKMRSRGTPLKDWDLKINYGVKTGYNKAFIIDEKTREALVAKDPKSAGIIKPVLRGQDIELYRAGWAGLFLIDAHNGYDGVPAIDIDDYPVIKAHLDKHYPQMAKRQDKGKTPYNLRSCAYHQDFSNEKLAWIDLAERGRFAYDNSGMFCLNSAFFMSGEALKYLCAILNSALVTWFVRNTALNSGMGTARWIRGPVERIPVPKLTTEEQRPFVRLVDKILEAKAADPEADTEPLEWEIDRLVYDLYGLSNEETAEVADLFWDGALTEEQEATTE